MYTDIPTADVYMNSVTGWSALTDAQKTVHMEAAGQYLNTQFTWKGVLADTAQVDDWPRSNVTDKEGRTIASDSIPAAIISAFFFLLEKRFLGQLYPVSSTNLEKSLIKVGPITVSKAYDGSSVAAGTWKELDVFVSDFVSNTGNRMIRG